VLVGGSELIDDIRRAPDDVLSMMKADEVRSAQNGALMVGIMQSTFKRDVASTFEEVRGLGELIMTIDDLIPTSDGA
jgi:hypothetical protein